MIQIKRMKQWFPHNDEKILIILMFKKIQRVCQPMLPPYPSPLYVIHRLFLLHLLLVLNFYFFNESNLYGSIINSIREECQPTRANTFNLQVVLLHKNQYLHIENIAIEIHRMRKNSICMRTCKTIGMGDMLGPKYALLFITQ